MTAIFEKLNDYETASYFYNRCLQISQEFKYIEGEALAHRGLGICEEKVLNKDQAMKKLELSLQKATEGQLDHITAEISRDLVRVYQQIAMEHLEVEQFDESLAYFEKCLQVTKSAGDKEMEAECHHQIGLIYELQGDLQSAIEQLNSFLNICEKIQNNEKLGEAHKKLADVQSKSGNTSAAIKHLEKVLDIAMNA